MTTEQHDTINRLRGYGYSVRVVKRGPDAMLLALARRLLTTGMMPLYIYPDGSYRCPWYDTRNRNTRRTPAWQN